MKVELTLEIEQLEDVVSCLESCRDMGLAYGQLTTTEQKAAEVDRQRLIDLLNHVYKVETGT